MQAIKKNFKLIIAIVIVVMGIYSIVLGIENSRYYGGFETETVYGGDAYTGIQNASAQTANNVANVGYFLSGRYEDTMVFIGVGLIVSGGLVLLYYLAENKSKKKTTD